LPSPATAAALAKTFLSFLALFRIAAVGFIRRAAQHPIPSPLQQDEFQSNSYAQLKSVPLKS
jgi:hypothetical protein